MFTSTDAYYPQIVDFSILDYPKLRIVFSNNMTGIYNFTHLTHDTSQDSVVQYMNDPAYFNGVYLEQGGIVFPPNYLAPDGVDLAPDAMYYYPEDYDAVLTEATPPYKVDIPPDQPVSVHDVAARITTPWLPINVNLLETLACFCGIDYESRHDGQKLFHEQIISSNGAYQVPALLENYTGNEIVAGWPRGSINNLSLHQRADITHSLFKHRP